MESARSYTPPGPGPFRVDQLQDGDPYELSDGHAIVAEPSGRRHARRNLAAAALIDSDPAVESAGVDAGYALDDRTLRAPDVAVGNLPDEAGFARGAPALAIEYVERDQSERALERKIGELLAGGTALVWVVRLGREWQVEVHRPDGALEVKHSGEQLEAPGILRNPVPVDALYDRELAQELTLRNLLQRHGYESLTAVRDLGHAAGRAEGALEHARAQLRRTLEARAITLDVNQQKQIEASDNLTVLDGWFLRALTASNAAEVFAGFP